MTHQPNAETPRFDDAAGRAWQPRLDYVKLARIRDRLQVDLGNVEEMGRTWALLLYDDLKTLDVVWESIAGDDGLAAGDVAKRDWLAAMDGERLDAARAALKAAIYLFTRPSQRTILLRGVDAVDETYRRAIGEAEQRVAEKIQAAVERAITATRGRPAPGAPASSDSSTTAGASAKRSRQSRRGGATSGSD